MTTRISNDESHRTRRSLLERRVAQWRIAALILLGAFLLVALPIPIVPPSKPSRFD
jgi:hypothetical protein